MHRIGAEAGMVEDEGVCMADIERAVRTVVV